MTNAKIDENSRATLTALASDASGDIVTLYADKTTHRLLVDATGGTGTVTQVDTGTGLTGGPITTTGTVAFATALQPIATLTGNASKFLRVNAAETAVEYATIGGGGDVLGPATNTNNNIPQWDGANSKTLKDGLAVPAGGLAGLTLVGTKEDKLTPTAVKTSAYNAVVDDLVLCDISAGSFTVTLPDAPADKSRITVRLVSIASNYSLTMQCSGTDTFNRATGPTSAFLSVNGEEAIMQYESSTKIWYITNTANVSNFATGFPGVDATTPITNADVSINTTTRVLTITPPLGYFNIFVDGGGHVIKFRKTGTINFPAFTDTSGIWYFYFDSTGTAVTTQTAWLTTQFSTIVPIYRLLWNATLYNFTITAGNASEGATYTNNTQTFTVRQTISGGTLLKTSGTGDPQASGTLTKATGTGDATLTFSAFSIAPRLVAQYVEYHKNTIAADDHQWFHLQGTQWITGFTMANNALTSGTPNADGRNTVIALTTGSNVDDNLEYTVTNDSTPTDPWQQDLGNTTPAALNATNSAMLTVFRQSATGTVTFRDTTRFPFDWNTVTNIPNYITAVGVRTPVTDKAFFVYFIYATQNPVAENAIKLVSATIEFTTIANARAYNWSDIQTTYTTFSTDSEIRPLYRLIFEYRAAYDAGAKYSILRETQDIRKAQVTSTTTASGSLPASSVTVVPAGSIASTNAQSALEELDTEKLALAGGTMTGNLIFSADNTLDIGASGATRPRTVYAGTSVVIAGAAALTSGGALGTPASGTLTNCTGLPIAGLVNSTTQALGVGSIELGAASDTTIARVSGGVVSIEGANIMTVSSADTVTGVKTLGTTGAIKLGSAVTDKCEIRLNDSALNDETWSGTVLDAVAGATLAVGDVCYLKTADGQWYLNDGILDGTDAGFKLKLGICVLAANDNDATKILLDGLIASAAFPAFTVGAPVYLDDTAGDLVVAQPTTTNFAIRVVGEAVSATVLHFHPSNDYIVHT